MSVAVIIVAWNAAPYLNRVLNCLAQQTHLPDRILVVDNGSHDVERTMGIVSRYPNCELHCLPDNRGFAAANNIGVAKCPDVEFIALLNPDAFPEPQWLAALLQAAERSPDVACFASRLLNEANDAVLDGAGDYVTVAGKPGRRGHGGKAKGQYLDEEEVFSPCAAAALYRRDVFMAVGGFDERFFCYVEDVDLAFRMRLAGHGCLYVPSAVARHVGSASSGRRSAFAVYHGQRNLVFNYVKNMPGFAFWALLPFHLAMNVAFLVGSLFAGCGPVVWKAKRDALRELPVLWRARRSIQRCRRVSTWRIIRQLRLRQT